jgi:succinoglycan biosynthesis protein ExoA
LSKDGTREKIFNLIKTDHRIVLIDNQKQITPVALNLGVKYATGDYIFILGAHSQIDLYYVYYCLQIFEKNQNVSCAGGPINSIGTSSVGKAIALAMSSPIGVGNAKHRFPDYEGYAEMACFPVFKKEVFNQIGYFDEELIRNQDDDFCFRLRKNGGKVYISSKVKSFYFVRDSIKSLFRQYYQYGYWRIALLKKHKLPIALRQQVPFVFFSLIFMVLIIGLLLDSFEAAFFLPTAYVSILFAYTFGQYIIKKKNYIFWLPIVIFVLHFSYAVGFSVAWIKKEFSHKK